MKTADKGELTQLEYALKPNAIKTNRKDTVNLLLNLGAVPTCEAFVLAHQFEDETVYSELIKHEDVNTSSSTGSTPLMNYVADRHMVATRLLLESGANVDQRSTLYDLSALGLAITTQSKPLLKELMRYKTSDTIIARATNLRGISIAP